MRRTTIISLAVIGSAAGLWVMGQAFLAFQATASERAAQQEHHQAIETLIADRQAKLAGETTDDPFGDDDIIHILLVGLDTRIGQASGHCDAIQLITIDRQAQTVRITAVPRGTYAPLPPGVATLPSEYYLSNACGLVGLEYGIDQIEKVLGVNADYVVIAGFSEVLGAFRFLGLPTTETLQWLRHRQGYAIGEPQRAHNHSTFLKQMMVRFLPTERSLIDTSLHYLLYSLAKTDLSFAQSEMIVQTLSDFDLDQHPERIQLTMRPFYVVQDIAYDPGQVDSYLGQALGWVKTVLPREDYRGMSEAEVQTQLRKQIGDRQEDPDFLAWAYDHKLWLQVADQEESLTLQYDILTGYLLSIADRAERAAMLADYIIEMEYRGQPTWQERGKALLAKEL